MPSSEALAAIEQIRSQPPAPTAGLSFAEQREQSGLQLSAMCPLPADAKTESVTVAGVPALWVELPESRLESAILYLHGGGYVLGSILSHQELAARIGRAARAKVLVLDYGLAPESPYPTAVENAVDAYRALLDDGFAPGRVVLAGDSAGGGLTVATLVALRDRGIPLPAAGVALSPWADLTLSGDSVTSKVDEEPILDVDTLREWAGLYAGSAGTDHPLVSPLGADLAGLPPLLIQVGTAEVLFSDSERLVEALRAAGGTVEYQPEEGLFHCFPMFPFFPEAHQAVDRIGDFVRRHTGEEGA
jgi:acetyl esterase/lipase